MTKKRLSATISQRIYKEIKMREAEFYKSCSFTGHRRIEEGHKSALSELLLRAVEYVYERGCRDFYAGGAVGFDTFAARAVVIFRLSHPDVKLHLLLPCVNQSERWCEADKQSYEYTLSVADDIEYVADEYYDGCMKLRNERLVASADVMIAYLGRKYGGSAQTVRLAERAGCDVFNLYPTLDKSH